MLRYRRIRHTRPKSNLSGSGGTVQRSIDL